MRALLPQPAGAVVGRVERVADRVVITASAAGTQASCPRCATAATRVHSRYGRRVADAPISGVPVVIELSVRRFFCDHPVCPKRTFAEQIPGLTSRYARRSLGLGRMLAAVGLALAGRAGARLGAGLGLLTERACIWYGSFGNRPGRCVLVREPDSSNAYDLALFTLDPTATPAQIVERYAIRWSIEPANAVGKQQMGVGLERLGEESPRAQFFAASRRLMLDLLHGRTNTTARLVGLAVAASERAGLADAWMVIESMKSYAAVQPVTGPRAR